LYKSIIDWDDVSAIPINLSVISLAESFWRSDPRYLLNKENIQFFQTELSRIEQQTPSSRNLSHMLLHSEEHMFLQEILLHLKDLQFLKLRHPELLSTALERSSKNMAIAASLWAEFSNLFYTSQGLPVPDLPLYVEIKEGLGIYGHGFIERFLRKFKRKLTKSLNVFLDKLFNRSGSPEESYRISIGPKLRDF
jgi:hypothetical protein